MNEFVRGMKAEEFIPSLVDESVPLLLTDPPYYEIVPEKWDRQWRDERHFADWLSDLFVLALPKLTPNGSLVFFGAMGRHKSHPLFRIVTNLEDGGYTFRQWITWKKRRAFGKSHDYLYIREEILWFSKNPERTGVIFNKPYSDELRGYGAFNPKYEISDYKRVGNVWTDIPPEDLNDPVIEDITELFKLDRQCQKPVKIMDRLVKTHSNPGDLVVDPFVGWGTTGVAAVQADRNFLGCEAIEKDALEANQRVVEASPNGGVLDLI